MLKRLFFCLWQRFKFTALSLHRIDDTVTPIVFFPGCAAKALDKKSILGIKSLLEKKNGCPISLLTLCCGYPTRALSGDDLYQQRHCLLTDRLRQFHVTTIYTLCPNCTNELSTSALVVKSIWEDISPDEVEKREPLLLDNSLYLHDPCPSRSDLSTQRKARELLSSAGYHIEEFEHNREQTICCGRKEMNDLFHPNLSKKMAIQRVDESNHNPIATYCVSCRNAFRKQGGRSAHLLDLLKVKEEPND